MVIIKTPWFNPAKKLVENCITFIEEFSEKPAIKIIYENKEYVYEELFIMEYENVILQINYDHKPFSRRNIMSGLKTRPLFTNKDDDYSFKKNSF